MFIKLCSNCKRFSDMKIKSVNDKIIKLQCQHCGEILEINNDLKCNKTIIKHCRNCKKFSPMKILDRDKERNILLCTNCGKILEINNKGE